MNKKRRQQTNKKVTKEKEKTNKKTNRTINKKGTNEQCSLFLTNNQ